MERTLSARHTGLLKFVLPPVWIGVVGYAGWRLLLRPESTLVDYGAGTATVAQQWILLALLAVSLGVLFAFVVPLKRVRLAADGLHVSNYVRGSATPGLLAPGLLA